MDQKLHWMSHPREVCLRAYFVLGVTNYFCGARSHLPFSRTVVMKKEAAQVPRGPTLYRYCVPTPRRSTSNMGQSRRFAPPLATSDFPPTVDITRQGRHFRKGPTAEVAVAAYQSNRLRQDGASFRYPCFAETIDIHHLSPRQSVAGHPFRNAKIGLEFEQSGNCLIRFCFASQLSQGRREAAIGCGQTEKQICGQQPAFPEDLVTKSRGAAHA
jgi:hypothetical protein